MRILLVEDDPLASAWLKAHLEPAEGQFGDRVQVETLSTEMEFRKKLPEIAINPPSVIVLDVMLRWRDPEPGMEPPPKEVGEGGFFRAGIRCQRLLADDPRTRMIPVIFYSVLDAQDLDKELNGLPENVQHVRKSADLDELVEAIGAATAPRK